MLLPDGLFFAAHRARCGGADRAAQAGSGAAEAGLRGHDGREGGGSSDGAEVRRTRGRGRLGVRRRPGAQERRRASRGEEVNEGFKRATREDPILVFGLIFLGLLLALALLVGYDL